ncbi:hypothetical protein BJP25_14770 [Actinokineospora bangkokensis]|uniref:HTH luxR-type domain-containing protein n=1 Tax=Actinokineospora bangkokensis TaxID=1193682 RepID=A0A1Q9LPG3_9PSEU|nr:hypothetical protein BJP25_14770 [Actinokineospora bangkokensis]
MEAPRPVAQAVEADFLGALSERSGLCLARLDLDLAIRGANDGFARRFAADGRRVPGRRVLDLLDPQSRERLRGRFTQLAAGRGSWFAERVVVDGCAGPAFRSELTVVVRHDQARRVVGFVAIFAPEAPKESDLTGAGERRDRMFTPVAARVLELIAAGDSTTRIASQVHLSRQGVDYHIAAMLRRFGVPNRVALVSRAFAAGILDAEVWPPRVEPEFVRGNALSPQAA